MCTELLYLIFVKVHNGKPYSVVTTRKEKRCMTMPSVKIELMTMADYLYFSFMQAMKN